MSRAVALSTSHLQTSCFYPPLFAVWLSGFLDQRDQARQARGRRRWKSNRTEKKSPTWGCHLRPPYGRSGLCAGGESACQSGAVWAGECPNHYHHHHSLYFSQHAETDISLNFRSRGGRRSSHTPDAHWSGGISSSAGRGGRWSSGGVGTHSTCSSCGPALAAAAPLHAHSRGPSRWAGHFAYLRRHRQPGRGGRGGLRRARQFEFVPLATTEAVQSKNQQRPTLSALRAPSR